MPVRAAVRWLGYWRGYWKTRGETSREREERDGEKNFASNIYIYILHVHVYIHAYIVRCYLHGTVFTTIVAIGVGPRDASYAETKLACLFTYGWLHAFAHTVTRAIFKFLPRTHWEYNICGWNGTTRERGRGRGRGGGGRNIVEIKSRPDASPSARFFEDLATYISNPSKFNVPKMRSELLNLVNANIPPLWMKNCIRRFRNRFIFGEFIAAVGSGFWRRFFRGFVNLFMKGILIWIFLG